MRELRPVGRAEGPLDNKEYVCGEGRSRLQSLGWGWKTRGRISEGRGRDDRVGPVQCAEVGKPGKDEGLYGQHCRIANRAVVWGMDTIKDGKTTDLKRHGCANTVVGNGKQNPCCRAARL